MAIPGVGATPAFDSSVTNTVEAISNIPCRIFWINVENPGAAKAYLQLFNALAADVTLGTTVPNLSVPIPAGAIWDAPLPVPIGFTTACSVAATATATGSGAPASNFVLNLAKLAE
jgi:hypothetical protein